jgi:hypothetical protein
VERQWALLSKEQLSQSPAEINAYLEALRNGALTKQLKRVRAIFIGHGEVGKTSLIRALHGEDVIEGKEAMTQGVAIRDAIDEQAGVFTRVTDYKDDDLTVHFWDFGGQVMAHATHQFFLRSKCLYVMVLAGRAERNPNEEAEYWLEHVRAFGDSAPVLLVGNKADVMPVALDLQTLKTKYPNIVEFHSISCTKAKGTHRKRFELFRDDFIARLQALGELADRFSPAQFKVLKTIEQQAAEEDFIKETGFDEICRSNGIAMQGPGGRDSLLDLFDKLGIVMHFARLNYLARLCTEPTLAYLWCLHADVFGQGEGHEGAAQRSRSRRSSEEGECDHREWARHVLSTRSMPHHCRRHDRLPCCLSSRQRRTGHSRAACARAARA